MSHTYQQLGTRIGRLVDRKNQAYGSSFAKAGPFLQLLYPDGIRPDQLTDALLLVRIFDKQVRIATDADTFGESPYEDIAGYGLLGAQLHQERSARCQGSAKGPDAPNPPKAQPASAAKPTRTKTTPSAAAPNVPPSSPNTAASRGSFSERGWTTTDAAPAPTAPAPASASGAVHASDLLSCEVCR